MAARKKPGRPRKPAEWSMGENLSCGETGFRIWFPGKSDYGLEIARFHSELDLGGIGVDPNRSRSDLTGLVFSTTGYETRFTIVPEDGAVKADARLSLDYCDEIGPSPCVNAYFSSGKLVTVAGHASYFSEVEDVKELRGPDENPLNDIFMGVIVDKLRGSRFSFQRVQETVSNSNLPSHYKNAVREFL